MPGIAEPNDALIDRYLNDKLNDAERAAFEVMMLEDELLCARVQLLDAFKNSLSDERAALAVKLETPMRPFRVWLRQPLSLAASLVVLGLGLQIVYANFTARDAAPPATAIDTVFVLEATRGAEPPVLSGAPPYLFQVDAGPGAANLQAAVTLRAADGAERFHVDAVQVDGNGWARVVVERPLSGAYTLELIPSGSGASRRFALTIND